MSLDLRPALGEKSHLTSSCDHPSTLPQDCLDSSYRYHQTNATRLQSSHLRITANCSISGTLRLDHETSTQIKLEYRCSDFAARGKEKIGGIRAQEIRFWQDKTDPFDRSQSLRVRGSVLRETRGSRKEDLKR